MLTEEICVFSWKIKVMKYLGTWDLNLPEKLHMRVCIFFLSLAFPLLQIAIFFFLGIKCIIALSWKERPLKFQGRLLMPPYFLNGEHTKNNYGVLTKKIGFLLYKCAYSSRGEIAVHKILRIPLQNLEIWNLGNWVFLVKQNDFVN